MTDGKDQMRSIKIFLILICWISIPVPFFNVNTDYWANGLKLKLLNYIYRFLASRNTDWRYLLKFCYFEIRFATLRYFL